MGNLDIGQFLNGLVERGIISVTQLMVLLGFFNTVSESADHDESPEQADGYGQGDDHDDSLEHANGYDLNDDRDDSLEHANGYDLNDDHDDSLEHAYGYDLDDDHDDSLEHANGYDLNDDHDDSLEHAYGYDLDDDHDNSLEHANGYDLNDDHDGSLEHANGRDLDNDHDDSPVQSNGYEPHDGYEDAYEYLGDVPYAVRASSGYSELSDDRFDQFRFELGDGEFADGDLVDAGETLINKFELGRRGWKLDRLDVDESLSVQVYGNEAFIIETELEHGSVEFKIYSDLDGDQIWTEVVEGEVYSANTASTNVDLVGLVDSGVVNPLMLGITI